MARMYNNFEFIGELGLPKAEKLHQINESASGWVGHRLNFAVNESKTNGVYVEMYGGYNKAKANKVFAFSKGTENVKGSKLEIAWDDRLSEDSLNVVADFKKIVVDFTTDPEVKKKIYSLRGDIRQIEYKDEETVTDADRTKLIELRKQLKEIAVDRHEFIHEYDAVVFLAENLDSVKLHKFKVSGSVEYQQYQGNTYRKFKPNHLEIVDAEEKNKLRATLDLFFTKDVMDDKDFAKDKLISLDTYAIGYDSTTKKDQFFSQPVVINAAKLDLENETHMKRLEFLKKQFDVKKGKVNHLAWEVSVFRGADTVEFTEKDLTAEQKEMIELGLTTLDDLKPKGGTLGETVEENRLVKPLYKEFDQENDFRTGAIETDIKEEDLVYVPSVPEEKKEQQKDEKVPESSTVELEDLDAAFA